MRWNNSLEVLAFSPKGFSMMSLVLILAWARFSTIEAKVLGGTAK